MLTDEEIDVDPLESQIKKVRWSIVRKKQGGGPAVDQPCHGLSWHFEKYTAYATRNGEYRYAQNDQVELSAVEYHEQGETPGSIPKKGEGIKEFTIDTKRPPKSGSYGLVFFTDPESSDGPALALKQMPELASQAEYDESKIMDEARFTLYMARKGVGVPVPDEPILYMSSDLAPLRSACLVNVAAFCDGYDFVQKLKSVGTKIFSEQCLELFRKQVKGPHAIYCYDQKAHNCLVFLTPTEEGEASGVPVRTEEGEVRVFEKKYDVRLADFGGHFCDDLPKIDRSILEVTTVFCAQMTFALHFCSCWDESYGIPFETTLPEWLANPRVGLGLYLLAGNGRAWTCERFATCLLEYGLCYISNLVTLGSFHRVAQLDHETDPSMAAFTWVTERTKEWIWFGAHPVWQATGSSENVLPLLKEFAWSHGPLALVLTLCSYMIPDFATKLKNHNERGFWEVLAAIIQTIENMRLQQGLAPSGAASLAEGAIRNRDASPLPDDTDAAMPSPVRADVEMADPVPREVSRAEMDALLEEFPWP